MKLSSTILLAALVVNASAVEDHTRFLKNNNKNTNSEESAAFDIYEYCPAGEEATWRCGTPGNPNKVQVCHWNNGNGYKTICVDDSGAESHLGKTHNAGTNKPGHDKPDYCGPCTEADDAEETAEEATTAPPPTTTETGQCSTYRVMSVTGQAAWMASPTFDGETDCIPNAATWQDVQNSSGGSFIAIAGDVSTELTASITDTTCTIIGAAMKNGDVCTSGSIAEGGGEATFAADTLAHVEVVVMCCDEEDCEDTDVDLNDANTIGTTETVTTTDFPRTGGSYGDPHIKTWTGQVFDFHGECDLVLAHSDKFASGQGLDIHIRTEIRHDWSFISGVALRIGEDVLEVAANSVNYLNGVKGAVSKSSSVRGKASAKIAGFPITFSKHMKIEQRYEIDLGEKGTILIKAVDKFMSVNIRDADGHEFGDAVGLMGNFATGDKLYRNGLQAATDNDFGVNWQVRDHERQLFQKAQGPQYPVVCRLPDPTATSRRRLDESEVSYEEAFKACQEWDETDRDTCIYDVLSTGELAVAQSGVF